MSIRMLTVGLLVLTIAGCARHTLTGTYTAQGPRWAAMVQLTEGADHRIMGNVVSVELTADGEMQRADLNVTDGTVDAGGDSIVLTMKAAGLLAEDHNATGKVTGAGLDLDLPAGTIHLARGSADAFARASQTLQALGHKEQSDRAQKKQAAEDAQRVAELAQQLASYSERIAHNPESPDDVRRQEEQLVAAARKDLGIERSLAARHQDYAAGQAQFRIGQLSFQLGQRKLQIEQAVQQGRDHVAAFDRKLAASHCAVGSQSPGCSTLMAEQARYQVTRAKVVGDLGQLEADLQKNVSAMDVLNKAAGN